MTQEHSMRHWKIPWLVITAIAAGDTAYVTSLSLPPMGDEIFRTIGHAMVMMILGLLAAPFHSKLLVNSLFYTAFFCVVDLTVWYRIAEVYHYRFFGRQLLAGLILWALFFGVLEGLSFGQRTVWKKIRKSLRGVRTQN